MNMVWARATKQDQILPTGSVIHWGQPEPNTNPASHRFRVTCGICKTERWAGVTHKATWTGYCRKCVARSGLKSLRWKGGRIARYGYTFINVAILSNEDRDLAKATGIHGSYIAEHRLVAAKKIGRPLAKGEVVHHLNEIKTDNRPSNLVVTSKAGHGHEHSAILKAARAEVLRLQRLLEDHGIPY